MKRLDTDVLKQQFFTILFYGFLTAGIMSPIAVDSFIPALADYINHLAEIIQAKMAISEGQFPIRVAPLDQDGWRYPYFQFYSPTTYTFSALIYRWLTPNNPLIAFKITIWSGLMIGGIYMNRLSYWFIRSKPIALLSSVVYLTSPYYIIVINDFCDLSEILGLGMLPMVLFYTFQRYHHPNVKNLISAGLAWYLIITIHSVTFIYSAFIITVLLLFLTIKTPSQWKNLVQTATAIGFACLLAMWYLAPINLLGKYILISQTFTQSTGFSQFAPVLSQLLFPGGSQFQKDLIFNHPAIGWTILLSAGVCTYAFFHHAKIHSKRLNDWLPALLLSFYVTFVLIWSPINFWQWFPQIFRIGQYSWRLLGQLNWIGALLFSWALAYFFPNKLELKHVILGLIPIIVLSSQWFPNLNSSNVDIEQFKKKPYFVYNKNAYSINFNKNTEYVDSIDTMFLYSLMAHNILQIGVPYYIPRSLLTLAAEPYISIEGQVKPKPQEPVELSATINDKIIAKKAVAVGDFHWDIPLNNIATQFKEGKNFTLKFNMNHKMNIAVNKVVLTGFLPQHTTLPVLKTQAHCKHEHAKTFCDITVKEPMDLIELPILYYPKLLKISLNKKEIPYQSIVYYDSLITGIKPQQGQNKIAIEFRGLPWANWISRISWGLVVILGLTVILTPPLTRHKERGDLSHKGRG